MTPEQERLAEEIFAAVCELPKANRAAAIEARCTGQPEGVRASVHELLAAFDDAGNTFLNPEEIRQLTMVGRLDQAAQAEESTLPPGTRLGAYTIQRVLGAGGMGVVYVALQERPRRTVALKVIRRGLGTTGLVRRFEHEAEMLARLQHPGIAQVFEAGSEMVQGVRQPYIAMELVEGLPLTDHAERAKLHTRDRLELLARVCDAVHHAHQRGVIHRDLKPANILVTADAQPKVLDFGVARAADADLHVTTMRTGMGQLIGTLAYMSPEQVAGDPGEVDIRSDVYALGVILYQVLSGKLPHEVRTRSLPEAVRAIRDDAPERLSRVSHVFRGEIDTIVAKAMEKDKARRYQSAAELADDLRRHLSGAPIHATRDTLYVLGKQISRYRWAVAAAGAAVLGLAGFSIYASWQAGVQTKLAADALKSEQAAEDARGLADRRSAQLERALYQSRIGYANAAVVNGDLQRAADQLQLCRPEDRGWEWHHIRYRCDQSLTQVPLAWEPRSAKLTADGQLLLSADDHGVIHLADPVTGRSGRVFESDVKYIDAVPSPDGTQAACVISRAGVDIIEIATGRRVRRIDAPPRPAGLEGFRDAVWVDGGRAILVSAVRADVFVFDATTGEQRLTWKATDADIHDIVLTENAGTAFIIATDGLVRAWDVATGTPRHTLQANGQTVNAALSPDGSCLALGLHQARVLLWNWQTETTARELEPAEGPIAGLRYSPDGRMIVASQQQPYLSCWDIETGKLKWRRRSQIAATVGLLPAGPQRMIALGRDGVMRTWSLHPRPPIPSVATTAGYVTLRAMPDGSGVRMVSTKGTIITIDRYSLAPTVETMEMPPSPLSFYLRPDGGVIGTLSTGEVWSWDGQSPRPERTPVVPRGFSRVDLSADGRRLAVLEPGGVVTIVNVDDMKSTSFPTTVTTIGGVQWLPDGDLLVGDARKGIQRWTAEGKPVGPKFEFGELVQCFEVSPDGSLLVAASSRGALFFHNLADGSARRAPVDTGGEALCVAFFPDGSRFVTGHIDRMARVWDAATCEEVTTLIGHSAGLVGACVLPDGPTIATADSTGTVRFWEVQAPRIPCPPAP